MTRVVMLREVPCTQATRIMWRMWHIWGYSSRPCVDASPPEGWLAVEFWTTAPSVTADILPSYEWELDDALLSRKVRARFRGSGARIEA